MNYLDKSTLCPVCGYDLGFEPWKGNSASHEICPSCGIEFGYDDIPEGGGLRGTREEIYEQWRSAWIEGGMLWFSAGRSAPQGRNPRAQLRRLGIEA